MPTNISRIFINAPAEKVWYAITEPQWVKQWQYGSQLTTDWNVGSRISFTAEWEEKVFEQWGKVLKFEPYKNLSYTLFVPSPGLEDSPENYFEMEYILSEKERGTHLEIIQKDNRKGAQQEEEQGEENPVLKQLKTLVENL